MANFQNNAITDVGRSLLSHIQMGAVFTPTKIVVGSGYMPPGKTARTMTDVVTPVKSLDINKKERTNDAKAIFGGVYSNQDISKDWYFRELALYAKAVYPDGTEIPECLYSYGNTGDQADLMPAYTSGQPVERQMDLVVYVGNDAKVDLTIESGVYMTKEQAENLISEVMASKVGEPNGVAELDEDGVVPSEQMPGYAVTIGVCAMGQNCPGGPVMLDNIQGNTVLGGTPAYNAPVSIKSVEGPLRLHVAGKNLVDFSKADKSGTAGGVSFAISEDGEISLSGTAGSSGAYVMPFGSGISKANYLPAGNYYLSCVTAGYPNDNGMYFYANVYNASGEVILKPISYDMSGASFSLTTGAWVAVNLFVRSGTHTDGISVRPQIEIGSRATDYETPSNTTVNIPLIGAGGQALEPLRMAYAGTVSIPKTAHYDRIVRLSGDWCIERKIKSQDLTGAAWTKSSSYMTPYVGGSPIVDGVTSYYPFCTHFVERGANASNQSAGIWVGSMLVVGNDVLPNGAETTAAEMQEFCSAQAEAGTPVLVSYALAQPVYEVLHQDVQVLLNTLAVPGGVCSVWFEGDILLSGADIALPRGDYPNAGVEGAYRWLEELSNPLPPPTTADLYAWALSQQRGGVFATSGAVTTQNVPEAGDLTGILAVTEQGADVSMLVFGPTGKLHTASRIAGVWRGWTTLYSSLSKPTPAEIGAIPTTQKGAASGVATLDSGKKIPVEQIPNLEYDSAGSASKVQTALTQHTSNKNNPHGVTAAQVGAAATSHKHSTSDITGGTLPVSRGGTGVSSLTGTDYGTYRVRGIAISDTIPSSISNGQICLVY